MATKLYLRETIYRQNWYPGTYNQGATGIKVSQCRFKSGEYMISDSSGSYSSNSKNWFNLGHGGPTGFSNCNANYIFQNAYYIATSAGGGSSVWRLTSQSGVWSNVYTNSLLVAMYDFADDGTNLVVVGNNGLLAYTTNGTTWTESTSARTALGNNTTVWCIGYSSSLGLWVAAGSGGNLATATSPNGTWTARTSSFGSSDVYNVKWSTSLGIFVAVGISGKIATSTNGTTWTQQTSGISSSIYSVAANGSQLVACSTNGTILRSTNGTTWTNAKPLPGDFTTSSGISVLFVDSTTTAQEFLAVSGATIYRSTDNGVTWSPCGTELSSAASYNDTSTSTATNINNLKELLPTPGTAQNSLTQTFPAQAVPLNTFWSFWATRPFTASATVGGGNMTFRWAGSESNAAANWLGPNGLNIYVWRPSTGAIVGNLVTFTSLTATYVSAEVGTGQTAPAAYTIATSSVSASAGDIVVVELWSVHTPGMSTAYNGTLYFNGTTEGSTTTNAAYVEFAESFPLPDTPRNVAFISG